MTVKRPLDAEHSIKLNIADIIIELKSQFIMEPLNERHAWRFKNFIYEGKKNAEIILDIEAKTRFTYRSNKIFMTVHPSGGKTNWSLLKKGNEYVIKQYIPNKRYCAVLNNDFSKGTIYLLSGKKEIIWRLEDIIYDLLQIILINYLSQNEGIFVHSIGLKDIDKSGFLFAGPTQSGKSTTARLWHKHSRANVLNDDRIVIRKVKKKFYIFRTPWHGDFSDYLRSSPDKAELKSIFFIYHNTKNKIDFLRPKESFGYLYPNIFPIFWNKKNLEKQIDLCQELVSIVPSYRFGFKNDKSVISAVRSIK